MTAYPSDLLDRFRETVDADAVAFTAQDGVPLHWRGYLEPTTATRVRNAQAELRMIGDYFPEASGAIAAIVVDAILVVSPLRGLCRIFGCQVEDAIYVTWSNPPTAVAEGFRAPGWNRFVQRAPQALVWIHQNVMDGLVDSYGFGGFYPSAMLTSMEDQIDTYANGAWFTSFELARHPGAIIEYFASGGGAYLLLDLNDDLSRTVEPQALLIDMKDGSDGPRSVDLFPYLDTWMAMALGGVLE
jgi:hypothetical protein